MTNRNLIVLFGGVFTFLIGLVVWYCEGHFIYTIDDTYIHLAFSERLMNGTYGMNPGEFSTPSSSILWPFLLVPFVHLSIYPYLPLIINGICLLGTVIYLNHLILRSGVSGRNAINLSFLVFFVLSLNLYGLAFTGMEHSLHVLMTVYVLYQSIRLLEEESVSVKPFLVVLTLSPLVRYEAFPISFIGFMVLLYTKRCWRETIISLGLVSAVALIFSAFIFTTTGDLFPSSVVNKGINLKSGFMLERVKLLVDLVLFQPNSMVVVPLLFALTLLFVAFTLPRGWKILSFGGVGVFVLHCMFSCWLPTYPRHQIYMLTFILPLTFYLVRNPLRQLFQAKRQLLMCSFLVLSPFFLFPSKTLKVFEIPPSSCNIYLQQYQMSKFVREFYNGKVGINDLGYVAFRNPHYILDYQGLGSREARELRGSGVPNWMDDLARRHDVKMAIIYESWFQNEIPSHWIKVADLQLGVRKITCAESVTTFYAIAPEETESIKSKLKMFDKELPEKASLVFFES